MLTGRFNPKGRKHYYRPLALALQSALTKGTGVTANPIAADAAAIKSDKVTEPRVASEGKLREPGTELASARELGQVKGAGKSSSPSVYRGSGSLITKGGPGIQIVMVQAKLRQLERKAAQGKATPQLRGLIDRYAAMLQEFSQYEPSQPKPVELWNGGIGTESKAVFKKMLRG